MRKSIIKSIRSQHVCNILNLIKTIEIDKSAPKEWKDYLSGKTKEKPAPREVLIYCTKGTIGLYDNHSHLTAYPDKYFLDQLGYDKPPLLNGKVVAKFTLNKVEEIKFDDKQVQERACLTEDELFDYLFINKPYQEDMHKGYAWHINNLEIFNEPKEISEFQGTCNKSCAAQKVCKIKPNCNRPLTKAPQSWCYCLYIENKEED